jgi:hypothetical protein
VSRRRASTADSGGYACAPGALEADRELAAAKVIGRSAAPKRCTAFIAAADARISGDPEMRGPLGGARAGMPHGRRRLEESPGVVRPRERGCSGRPMRTALCLIARSPVTCACARVQEG